MYMKTILFVRGFDTKKDHTDVYQDLRLFMEKTYNPVSPNEEYQVVYIDYDPSESIAEVYDSICRNAPGYDILIGHSLGGGLLAKYVRLNSNKIPKSTKIILLMPILYRSHKGNLASAFCDVYKIFDPLLVFSKGLLMPAQDLFETGNILNSDFSMVSFKQTHDLYNDRDAVTVADISLFTDNKNVTLFYAEDERVNTIDNWILERIPRAQLIRVKGLHECWRSIHNDTENFFTRLREIIVYQDKPSSGSGPNVAICIRCRLRIDDDASQKGG